MGKREKSGAAVAPKEPVEPVKEMVELAEAMPITPLPDGVTLESSALFDLYVARVAKAETVNTMRRDVRQIFVDAYKEAKVALEVFDKMQKQEVKS